MSVASSRSQAPLARVAGAPAPLSFGQEALFLLQEMLPESPLYNVPCAWRIRGPLDGDAFAGALRELAARHEILRTRFGRFGDELAQLPDDLATPSVETVDLTGRPEADVLEAVRRRARRPLGLRAAPPLAATLIRRGTEDHVFVLVLHHILTDGWSTGVIERDLGELYRAQRVGDRPRLPELPLQYADFAARQRQTLNGERLAAAVAHWRTVLDGVPPTLDLPLDRKRGEEPDVAGDCISIALPSGLGPRLADLGREHGATLYMVLLAALESLLFRHTQRRSFVVGSPLAGREQVEYENLIGLFVNPVCARADVRPEQSFLDLLTTVRARTIEAIGNQALPFDVLVAELAPQRHLNRNPVFQVVLDLVPSDDRPPGWADLDVAWTDVAHETSKFDLTTFAELHRDGELKLDFEYRTALFDRDRIERLGGHLRTLLLSILDDPTTPMGRLAMLTAEEEAATLRVSGPSGTGRTSSWIERFTGFAARRPEAIAVRDGEGEQTYAQVEARARGVAARLIKTGVGRGDRVGICLSRSADLVAATIGVALSGAAFVPLDPIHPDARLAGVLAGAEARCALVDATTAERLHGMAPALVRVRGTEGVAANLPEIRGEDLAYVLYTSGSTGSPKGVMVEHRQLAAFFDAFSAMTGDAPLVWRGQSSTSYDTSLDELLWTMTTGRTVEIVEDPLAPAGEATAMVCTPSLAKLMLASEDGREDLGRFECIVLGGEILPAALAEGLLAHSKGPVINGYGPTEATICATFDVLRPGEAPTIGSPMLGYGAYVVDPQGELAPVGVPGELWLTGTGIARGYHGAPRITAESFVPDPWSAVDGARAYRTGDLAVRLADGRLQFLGRRDEQVKISGVRIELAEAEAVLREQPGIADAAVIAHELGASGLGLIAFVVREGVDAPGPEELRRAAARQLPPAAVPVHYVRVEALPLLVSGKVDRGELRRRVPRCLGATAPELSPAGDPEKHVRAAWERVLGGAEIGLDDSFFDCGGRSILLLDVAEELRARGYAEVSIVDLYRLPTIRALAAHLRGSGEEGRGESAGGRGRARRMALRARREQRR